MKTQDLLVLGGIGVLAYMLVSKPKEAEAKIPTFITIPSAEAIPAALDIGGLFSGIASIFGAMPSQIVPEINIPEFKFPDIEMPEITMPEISMPDWEKFIPAIPEELKIPDIPSLLPQIPSIKDIIPTVGNGEGLPGWNIPNLIEEAITGLVSARETTIFSSEWWTSIMPHIALTEYGQWRREYGEESEAEWAAKGYPEEITPEWYYAQKAKTRGLLPQDLLAAKEAVSGLPESAALPYQEYMGELPTYLQRKIWEQK